MVSSPKQKQALAQSQAIMKLTPKYRAKGMSLKDAWAAAKKEFLGGEKNPKIPAAELKFREGRKRGSVMKPKTFKKIERKAKKAGYKHPRAVAGAAYWKTLLAKFKAAMKKRNPADPEQSMVELYPQVLEVIARKGKDSHFPGEEFYHPFEKNGSGLFGLPAGTVITLPDGDSVTLNARTLLVWNQKGHDLWDLFKQ